MGKQPKADGDTPKSATPTTALAPGSEQVASTADSELQEVLCTSWTCVATTGLEEFLKHSGVGVFQRKLAMAARWPAWEFTVHEGSVHFLNHSAMGDLHEERNVEGDTLTFSLTSSDGATWGRVFTRA